MKKIIGAILVAGLVACGPPGNQNGNVRYQNGESVFSVEASIFAQNEDSLVVLMSNAGDVCSRLKANSDVKNAATLTFVLVHTDENGEPLPITTGDYKIVDPLADEAPTGKFAYADLSRTDAECKDTVDLDKSSAVSGSVGLSSVDLSEGGQVGGSFDILMGMQKEKFMGSFGASHCDLPVDDQDMPACG